MSTDKQIANKAKVAEYEATWKKFENPMKHPKFALPWHFGFQDELEEDLVDHIHWPDWAHEHFDELAENGHLIIAGVDAIALYDVSDNLEMEADDDDMDHDGMELQLRLEEYECRYLIVVDINDDKLPVLLWAASSQPKKLGTIDKFFKDLVPFDAHKYLLDEGLERFTMSYE